MAHKHKIPDSLATRALARAFLEHLIAAVPYQINTLLTDNGIQFAKREDTQAGEIIPFDRVCLAHGLEYRLTRIKHPWTNGQVERMNRTLKEATVKQYYYQTHEHLKMHLQNFLMVYNYTRRLNTLNGLTPYEYVCKIGAQEPHRFNLNPSQHTVRLNTEIVSASSPWKSQKEGNGSGFPMLALLRPRDAALILSQWSLLAPQAAV